MGEIDLCFATAETPLPPGAFSEPLASDRLVLVMRRGHPASNRPWSLADYASSPHATVAFFGDGVSEIDARLAAAGLERRIALTTPHFMATVAAVAGSDLVTTISAAFARRFAAALDLVLSQPPFPDRLELTTVGLRLRAADPAMQWFRRMLREEAAAVYAVPFPARGRRWRDRSSKAPVFRRAMAPDEGPDEGVAIVSPTCRIDRTARRGAVR